MLERVVVNLTKIISIYCLFYIVVKIIAISKGAWLKPNLMLIFILFFLGFLGFYMIRLKQFSMGYAIVGTISLILLRIFESELLMKLHQAFQ